MSCHLVVFTPQIKVKSEYTCDEENTTRVVQDEHAATGTGEYTDTAGKPFRVDWRESRLISFSRERQ